MYYYTTVSIRYGMLTVDNFNLGLDENDGDDDDATDESFYPIKDKDIEKSGDHNDEFRRKLIGL